MELLMRNQNQNPDTHRDSGENRQVSALSKFQRYRKAKSERGMRLLRLWVTDPTHPGFAQEAARQAALLRGRPEEREALSFIEAAFEWPNE